MITGASSGLGEALAHIFYSCGCKVILVARRKNELERVKNDLMKYKVSSTIFILIGKYIYHCLIFSDSSNSSTHYFDIGFN